MDIDCISPTLCLFVVSLFLWSCAGDPRNVYSHNDMAEQSFYDCTPTPEIKPKLISGRVPTYPPRRMAAGQPGYAAVEFDISNIGTPTNVQKVESTHSAFYTSTKNALLDWSFEPALIDSQPVSVRCKYTQAFGYIVNH